MVEIIDQHTGSGSGFSWSIGTPKEFQLGPDGFTWEMDSKSDTFQTGALATSVSFDLQVTDTNHDQIVDVIKGSYDGRFGVALYSLNAASGTDLNSGNTFVRPYWFGIVSNEDVNWFPYTHPGTIRIEAHCGLALLNSIPYQQADGSAYDDWANLGTHLQRIMTHIPTTKLWGYTATGTGLKLGSSSLSLNPPLLQTHQWFFDKTYHLTSSAPPYCLLGVTGAHSSTFYDIEREEDIFGGSYTSSKAVSCAEVLKNILSVLNLRMFQYNGSFIAHNPLEAGVDVAGYYSMRARLEDLPDVAESLNSLPVASKDVELYSSGFEQIAGVQDAFLFPLKESKSIHKKGGSKIILSGGGYSIYAANELFSITQTPELRSSSLATVESNGAITLAGKLILQEKGNFNDPMATVNTAMIGAKPIISMTVKVGNYYLKRDLTLSGNSYNIDRNLASDLTYKPHIQSGDVEWTTTESTYDFVFPFQGTDQEPAVYYDSANEIDVVGGLHIALREGNSDPFKYRTGFIGIGSGTQHTSIEADIAWTLPQLPVIATEHVGVSFKASILYKDRDSDNNIPYGPSSSGGQQGSSALYTPAFWQNFKCFVNVEDNDADITFSAQQGTNYANELSAESCLGDRYLDQSMGRLSLNDVNDLYNNYQIAQENWVTLEDTSATPYAIHRVIARENLFMRAQTLRTRTATAAGVVKAGNTGRNPLFTSGGAGLNSLHPLVLIDIIDEATTTSRKWYVTSMAFTASSAAYDLGLILVDTDNTIGPAEDDNSKNPIKGGSNGTTTSGDAGNNTTSVGLAGGKGTTQNVISGLNQTKEKVSLITVTAGVDLDTMKSDVTANNSKVGITTQQASDISTNTAKVGITTQQASDISTNNSKISYTDSSAVAANTAKVGITTQQASDISSNNAKISYTDSSAVAANTAKVGITTQQASDITANNSKVGITTQQASDISTNNSKVGITTQQASDISTNNAKTGITSGQASAITTNSAKVGITTGQADEITANTAKVGITPGQASAISANTAKVGITTQQSSDITANNAKVGITTQQASDIATNNAKTGITSGQATAISNNTAKVGITTGQADQITANTAKVGITTGQASAITANTAKTGISTQQASDITTNNAKVGITTQQASDITTNNAKVGITTGQATALTNVEAITDNFTVDGGGNITAITTAANAISVGSIQETSSNQFASASQLAQITANSSAITTNASDISDIEDVIQSVTSGGGKGVYFTSGKSVSNAHVTVIDKGANLFAGNNTGVSVTETSPGTVKLSVQAGSTGSEVQVDAVTITGSGSAQAAQVYIASPTAFANGATGISSSTITEGSKMFYTTARFDSRFGQSSVEGLNDVTSVGSGAIITAAERTKLGGIATGAEVNVNADWNATSGDAQILNKPTIPAAGIAAVVDDTTPQLGGQLDVNGNEIVGAGIIIAGTGEIEIGQSSGNNDIVIDPSGTGAIVLRSNDIKMEGAGTVTMAGVKFYEASLLEGNYVALTAPLSIASNVTWTLPAADGTTGQVIQTNGSGTLSFATVLTQSNPVANGTLQISPVGGLSAQLRLNDDAGNNYAIIKVPSDLTANYTLTLPANDGDANQVLKTDGSGVLSWVDQSGGGGGGGGMTETPFFNTSGRITFSSADDGERVILGGTYGPTSFYSDSQEMGDYVDGTVDSQTHSLAAYLRGVGCGMALPSDSKKVRAKISYRIQNGNTNDFGFSIWSGATPDNSTASANITLRAKSATQTADSSSIRTYSKEFTTTSALSGGMAYFVAEHRSGSLTSTTYIYYNLHLFLVD